MDKKNYNNGKSENKATVISATAGVAGGIAAGVGAAAIWPNEAQADDNPKVEEEDNSPEIEKSNPEEDQAQVAQTTVKHVVVEHHVVEQPEDVVEVDEFVHMMDSDGNHVADVAQVSVNGEEILYGDTDLNGYADVMIYDANHNSIIEQNEVHSLDNSSIHMSQLQHQAQATNYVVMPDETPDLIQPDINSGVDYTAESTHDIPTEDLSMTDMPDYVNDADVDSYIG